MWSWEFIYRSDKEKPALSQSSSGVQCLDLLWAIWTEVWPVFKIELRKITGKQDTCSPSCAYLPTEQIMQQLQLVLFLFTLWSYFSSSAGPPQSHSGVIKGTCCSHKHYYVVMNNSFNNSCQLRESLSMALTVDKWNVGSAWNKSRGGEYVERKCLQTQGPGYGSSV